MGLVRTRREAICLVLGTGLGLLFTTVFRLVAPSGEDTRPAVRSVVRVAPSPPPASAPPAAGAEMKLTRHGSHRNTNVLPTWQQAAAAYRDASLDRSQLHGLLYQLDAKGLRKLAAAVADGPRSGRFKRALREIYRRWAEVDPLAALAQAQTLDNGTRDLVLFDATRGFVEAQPQQAAAYFAAPPAADARGSLRNLGDRQLMLNLALAGWAEQDGTGALAFLNGQPANALYPGPAGSLGLEFARQDPAAAWSWAMRLSDQSARSSALQGVITTWAQTDPSAAANAVLGLSGNADYADLATAFAHTWANTDMTAAAQWVAAQPDGAVQAKAAAGIVGQWASDDPAAAAAWAGTLPDAARASAYEDVAGSWARFDPAAARDWLNSLPLGNARDAAIDGYLDTWGNSDLPVDKLAWAGRISDPQVREGITVKLLNSWLGDAPQTARQWISQANLPASITGKLNGG